MILDRVRNSPHCLIVVTHGTDTMIETDRILAAAKDKVIMLTGSMAPARFRNTDAIFIIGYAIGVA